MADHSFTETKELPYPAEFLFDLVADVARYPDFLPWCQSADIHQQTTEALEATLSIGYGFLAKRFRSHVTLLKPEGDCPGEINVTYVSGPFAHLTNQWRFTPTETGTNVYFHVDFSFKSGFWNNAMGAVFPEATKLMIQHFHERAHAMWKG